MTTGGINQVAFLGDARRAHEPAARRTGGTKAARPSFARRSFVSFGQIRSRRRPHARCVYRIREFQPPLADHALAGEAREGVGRKSGFGFARRPNRGERRPITASNAGHWVCGTGYRRPATSTGFSACLFRCDRRGLRVRASLRRGIQPNRASPIPLMRRA
ncbi:hypothetical protein H5410_064027 [Solanum commersonii]|uniref:Uncharacterized protein n=1 Tax=Solanum commersonii TaxID=4109 RepID=A0A9J5W0V0_SOLCO|nr:hypothetical protein H5410_064027 [Solanum commersonii]